MPNSDNFLSSNTPSIERLQDDDGIFGYDYNRLADALDGLRGGVVNLIDPIITFVSQKVLPAARIFDVSIDTSFPGFIDFVVPVAFTVTTATISWKARNFRYVPSGSGGGTTSTDATATTPSADATAESGHSHSHSHALTLANSTGAAVTFDGIAGALATSGGGDASNSMGNNATGSSGHSHSHTHGSHSHSHSHTFSGITFSYTEGTASQIDALLVDGVDKTSVLGGPWATDQVLINLLSVFPSGDGKWHTIQLTPHSQGRFIVEFTFGG